MRLLLMNLSYIQKMKGLQKNTLKKYSLQRVNRAYLKFNYVEKIISYNIINTLYYCSLLIIYENPHSYTILFPGAVSD